MGSIAPDDVRFMDSEYGTILSRFFEKIDFHLPKPYHDSSIEPALAKYIEEQP